MSTGTSELQDIQQTLSRLQARVRELTVDPDDGAADGTQAPPGAPADAAQGQPVALELLAARRDLLQSGIVELSTMTRLKEFPEFFLRLARESGLRLLLLKRWSSGLQVFLEENVKLPPEARR